jgi:hypothetical protein
LKLLGLAGAWFDFDSTFGKIESMLYRNLITTDHLGGTTKESKQKSEMIIAKKLKCL